MEGGFIEDFVTKEFDNSGHILWRAGLYKTS